MSKEDLFQWALACVVFVVFFALYFIHGFFDHCVFEWPIRWDVGTCWNEQISPSQQKAAEKAANFIP
jgi:hypothetical protein